jgi:TRAP-type C4-dicarboxylate transport system permease small subunit
VTNRFTAAIAYSLLFGFAIGILIWGCDQLWQSHKHRRQS